MKPTNANIDVTNLQIDGMFTNKEYDGVWEDAEKNHYVIYRVPITGEADKLFAVKVSPLLRRDFSGAHDNTTNITAGMAKLRLYPDEEQGFIDTTLGWLNAYMNFSNAELIAS